MRPSTDSLGDPPRGHIDLRPARPEDLTGMLALLEEEGLPTQGVSAGLRSFHVAMSDDRVVGVAGLEVYGSEGLLRSVAVESGWRGRGVAGRLTDEVLNSAREAGVGTVYLLTETAEGYFDQRGFARIDREAVPEAVRESTEFRELCPASAVAMAIRLDRAEGPAGR